MRFSSIQVLKGSVPPPPPAPKKNNEPSFEEVAGELLEGDLGPQYETQTSVELLCHHELFSPSFDFSKQFGIGGLDMELQELIRRAFMSRMVITLLCICGSCFLGLVIVLHFLLNIE